MFSCSLLDFVSDMNSNSRQVVVGGGDNAPEVVPPTPGASRPRQLNDNDGVWNPIKFKRSVYNQKCQ